jgi:hypothetical protein
MACGSDGRRSACFVAWLVQRLGRFGIYAVFALAATASMQMLGV